MLPAVVKATYADSKERKKFSESGFNTLNQQLYKILAIRLVAQLFSNNLRVFIPLPDPDQDMET